MDRLFYYFHKFGMDLEIEDGRSDALLGFDLQFINETFINDKKFPEQHRSVIEWLAAGGGVVQADTGTGKTVLLCYILCLLGRRAIIFDNDPQ